ncbi:hypothetical protein I316_01110 [Kwoniella heveanensis BCC8398]|uniref:Uncharacterized protein n=1 Tax=Kwoniella heveanensis BCC8398 TaxID=1296120 RepID=A0A1B9H1Q9_9TREE|nr:hypothetical protein I316_01110 [Kwoniella heveanensis BCC8398]
MDYLTILSTTRLVLFPDPTALPPASSGSPRGSRHLLLLDNSSPFSSPSTPTTPLSDLSNSITILTPTPVSMPLSSIVYSDTHTAYFLIHHIMTSSLQHITHDHHHHEHHDETFGHTCAAGGWGWGWQCGGSQASGASKKETMIEAEVMAWKEIDKAEMFARAVGKVFQSLGEGRKLENEELQELAARFGLGVQRGGDEITANDQDKTEGDEGIVAEGGTSHEKVQLLFA